VDIACLSAPLRIFSVNGASFFINISPCRMRFPDLPRAAVCGGAPGYEKAQERR